MVASSKGVTAARDPGLEWGRGGGRGRGRGRGPGRGRGYGRDDAGSIATKIATAILHPQDQPQPQSLPQSQPQPQVPAKPRRGRPPRERIEIETSSTNEQPTSDQAPTPIKPRRGRPPRVRPDLHVDVHSLATVTPPATAEPPQRRRGRPPKHPRPSGPASASTPSAASQTSPHATRASDRSSVEKETLQILAALRQHSLASESHPSQDFWLPFTPDEATSIAHRKFVRHPPPFHRISKSVYLTKTLPSADLPMHKCSCYVDTSIDSSARARQRRSEPHRPITRGRNSKSPVSKPEAAVHYCGETCENRMLYISCSNETCSAPDPALCTNRAIKRREFKPVHVQYVEGPGFGLFADDTIEAGEFIIEYVGEVIDDAECERRLIKCRDNGEQHFYMLEIERDIVIDARYRSNQARFINHSCDPNSMTQKWNVDGVQRIGIFARRRVLPHEEITIDYNFSHFGDPVECKCGSTACSGQIGLKCARRQTVDAVRKLGGSKKALGILATMEGPTEIKRPVLQTSLALLKSAGPLVQRKSTDSNKSSQGYPRRTLFMSHRRKQLLDAARKANADPKLAAASTALTASTAVPGSSGSSPLSSEWSSATEEDTANGLGHHDWYPRFQRGEHLAAMRKPESFISGGKLDWSRDLQDDQDDFVPATAPPAVPFKRCRKRPSLRMIQDRLLTDLMAFAHGKSKRNCMRRSRSITVDPDRIARFIETIKHGKQVQNDNLNDLHEDTCRRCGLAGELVCCDACPAAFHLTCANLVYLPPDNEPWFCSDCMKQARQRAQIEQATAAANASTATLKNAKEAHNLRQPPRRQASTNHHAAAPIVPHLKRIFHTMSMQDAPAKKRHRKRAKTTHNDLSYRAMEHLPLPCWSDDEDDDDDAE